MLHDNNSIKYRYKLKTLILTGMSVKVCKYSQMSVLTLNPPIGFVHIEDEIPGEGEGRQKWKQVTGSKLLFV